MFLQTFEYANGTQFQIEYANSTLSPKYIKVTQKLAVAEGSA